MALLRDAHPDLTHPGLAAALAGDDPDALAFAEALARDAGDATTAFWCAWSRVISSVVSSRTRRTASRYAVRSQRSSSSE